MSPTALLAPFPPLLVLGLLASGRVNGLIAGLAGLALTFAAYVGLTLLEAGVGALPARLAHDAPAGLWLAWPVVSIMIGGVCLHRAVGMRRVAPLPVALRAEARQLWPTCFLLAPFAESVTGFGVGYLIAIAALRGLGIGGMNALLLGLFSQSLVPWGAMAVGTLVSAQLAGLSPAELGMRCALLQMPIHLGYLLLYWRSAHAAGVAMPARQRISDLLWTTLLLAVLTGAHRLVDTEIAAATSCALLLALRHLIDHRPNARQIADLLHRVAPYAILVTLLGLTRLSPTLRETLSAIASFKPLADKPAYAPFYAPAFWLLCVALGTAIAARAPLRGLAIETVRGAWRPCAVTLSFLMMAQLYLGCGMADSLAQSLRDAIGTGALAGVPVFAAIGGFLTGSAAAASAMLMPMAIALGTALHADTAWIATVQNSLAANLSMLSPMRVSMGLAILGLGAAEAALYRRAWPAALPPLLVGLGAMLLIA